MRNRNLEPRIYVGSMNDRQQFRLRVRLNGRTHYAGSYPSMAEAEKTGKQLLERLKGFSSEALYRSGVTAGVAIDRRNVHAMFA